MLRRPPSALRLLALVLVSLGGCGDDPSLVVPSENPDDPNQAQGGMSSNPASGGMGTVVVPSGGTGATTQQGGAGGNCTGDDCTGLTCGNAVVDDGEVCDDGNAKAGDGCSGLCRVEPNFECDEPGEPCVSTVACGDSEVSGAEACDDGNAEPDDGCDADCQVEKGFACKEPGEACEPVANAVCGDGAVNFGETCDDGDAESDDGCSDECQLEPDYRCPVPGEECEPLQFCGDGKLSDDEDCDDKNTTPGDGCTGRCTLEPFYRCPKPGEPCETTIVCGDLEVVGDEACDDGNTSADDGCAADCKSVEPGYLCPTEGGLGGVCEEATEDVCGDAIISFGEFCDDGNTKPDDGCTAECDVTTGYDCPVAGQLCELISWCGDGGLNPQNGEECDDGDDPPVGGDGCSALCVIEDLYDCLVPGEPCVSRVKCGDRKLMATETCDDGNTTADDGCDDECQIEDGWICPPGVRCRARECGDGIVAGNEQCDDDGTAADDGCSPTCQLEPGFKCDGEPSECEPTDCGDGAVEGLEPCDDDNFDMGDGCTPFCQIEPVCADANGVRRACNSSCGDGIKFEDDDEQCDDGNTASGDGCSGPDSPLGACKLEPGYACSEITDDPPDSIALPLVLRDFKESHPDFGEALGGGDYGLRTGIARATLGTTADGNAFLKPVFGGCAGGADPCGNIASTKANFEQWYRDVPGTNRTILQTMTLGRMGNGQYQVADNTFYPLNGVSQTGWNETLLSGCNTPDEACTGMCTMANQNFYFTSEVRYWFEYQRGQVLDFTGDDDVFVFVNGRLAVDLGGVHCPVNGSVTLDAGTEATYGLAVGKIYEIVVFQAERHTIQSNYRLTLGNFLPARTTCEPVCGNGVVTPDEACDLGEDENTGEYGGCNDDCTLAPFCGDGAVEAGEEQCDNGTNVSTYGTSGNACAPGCVRPPRCGDEVVQGAYEACDEGSDNGAGYGHCAANCQLGPRCGDGVTQSPQEECDDVRGRVVYNGTSSSACSATCQLKCGNGVVDAGEQCDDGEDENTGGYGRCSETCRLGPRCGDGIRQANEGEACDDGKNDGSYGECAPGCELGPRCGDGEVQADAGERCDAGEDNVASGYGEDICTTQCRPAPYCGDRAVDVAHGEACDDGVNDGSPGSCEVDCSGWVPLPNCGDGNLDAGEQCDEGNSNGTANSSCDARCRNRCGNGVVDSGEECDDGVNDGSFGTCNSDCTLAGYCGDGNRDAPFEQCDEGDDNEDDPYGRGLCTTACAFAPFCGDGRIQAEYGEKCDGGSGCDRTRCIYIIPE
jgi:fibro-slime domain-containing protein